MDRFQQMNTKVRQLFKRAQELYGLDLSKTEINYRLRGRVAGKAVCRHCLVSGQKSYRVSFNKGLVMGQHFEDMLVNTTAHEVAHIVCMMDPRLGKDHNSGWRRVCIALGGDGSENHTYEVQYAGGNYIYTTNLGYEVVISANRHSRILKGKTYRVRGKGLISRTCKWRKQGNLAPVVSSVATAQEAQTPTEAPSYAGLIRGWITLFRPSGAQVEQIIQKAVAAGMRPDRAKATVMHFWKKM